MPDLTEKGKLALNYIKEFYPKGKFTAAELSAAAGEKIAAATLNGVANHGYILKLGGSPIEYEVISDLNELLESTVESKKGCDKTNLENAKKEKNDEFYTQYTDIEAEVMKYRKQFRGKIVYLPCDDPADKKSEFWSFFVNNFDSFGLKKLIATHYDEDGKAYKIWIDEDHNGDGFIDDDDALQEDLAGNGDFRSEECTTILKECDIVCTNPPFSMFREFVGWIVSEGKDFLIIGSQNAFSYQDIFRLIKNNQVWTGYNKVQNFLQPDGSTKTFGNICWYTTLATSKRYEELVFTKTFNDFDYPQYDNYEAINVDRVVNIPKDYLGVMGVPITFLEKYNPNQFDIIGLMASTTKTDINFGYPYLNGVKKYARVLIKHK